MAQPLRELVHLAEDPEFSSQHPHEGSYQSAAPVPGDLIPSYGLLGTEQRVKCLLYKSHVTTDNGCPQNLSLVV